MDLQNSVVLLSRQAAMVVDYGFIVGVIAVVIACASMYYKSWMVQELRRTGERHDNLQMHYFDPSRKVVVTRPEEIDPKDSSNAAKPARKLHPWRSRH
jgi:hypothetical protein